MNLAGFVVGLLVGCGLAIVSGRASRAFGTIMAVVPVAVWWIAQVSVPSGTVSSALSWSLAGYLVGLLAVTAVGWVREPDSARE